MNQIVWGGVVIVVLLVIGTSGYVVLENYSFLDALYMTSITLSTVGYGEVRPLSSTGRLFTVFLIFGGVGTVFYILGSLAQAMVEGKLRQIMGRRSLQREIRSLKDHYIICGHGRIGAMVSAMLKERGVKLVVVEQSQEVTKRLEDEGVPYVLGSATEDEHLLDAGVDRARGLVASVSSDADNLYIVMSAKGIRPDLFVIARADEPGAERKLRRAGADKVVSPYYMGARRIAQTVIRPSVADFIDLTFHGGDIALQMEELRVGPLSEMAGVALKDSGIRQKLDLIILAVKKIDGRMIFNPQAETVIDGGDTLIAMGTRASVEKLGDILAKEVR